MFCLMLIGFDFPPPSPSVKSRYLGLYFLICPSVTADLSGMGWVVRGVAVSRALIFPFACVKKGLYSEAATDSFYREKLLLLLPSYNGFYLPERLQIGIGSCF